MSYYEINLSIAVSFTHIENIYLSNNNNDHTLPGTGQDSKSAWMDFLKDGYNGSILNVIKLFRTH
jgi:hypothetical protein